MSNQSNLEVENQLKEINEYQARTILSMSDDERRDWDLLSDFEKKTITYFGYMTLKTFSEIEKDRFVKKLLNEV